MYQPLARIHGQHWIKVHKEHNFCDTAPDAFYCGDFSARRWEYTWLLSKQVMDTSRDLKMQVYDSSGLATASSSLGWGVLTRRAVAPWEMPLHRFSDSCVKHRASHCHMQLYGCRHKIHCLWSWSESWLHNFLHANFDVYYGNPSAIVGGSVLTFFLSMIFSRPPDSHSPTSPVWSQLQVP